MERVAQFYNVETGKAYCDGWPFPPDANSPEGSGWIKVISRRRVAIPTLARKAHREMEHDEHLYGII
jgi:hypothetical protein